jgi:purine-nucleoside phosphorylase
MSTRKIMKELKETVKFLKKQYQIEPTIGIVLGSGLGNFVNEIEVEKEIEYKDIPNFPLSTVEGHKSKLVFGKLSGKTVMAMAGRFHYYEGHKSNEVIFPIRVMKLLGVQTLLLSNAAGTVNADFKVGDLMIINDHISFFTPNPLIGKNIEELGPRFPAMTEPYKKSLIQKAKAIAIAHNFDIKEGVYIAVTGPTFETKAEYELIKIIGGDVVGMSTVQETIVANHMGMDVFAMSVVTDLGFGRHDVAITHEEVLNAAREAEPKMATIFKELVAAI